jgi:uncharacterized protein (DUF58 family)
MPALTLKVPRVANTPVLGTHGRKRPGQGDAFWQYDEYRPGQHETKRIAWRESAKSDHKTFVRQNEWEASQAAYIWVDNSPEMGFGNKREVAQVLGLALAKNLCAADERIALLGSDSALSNRIMTMVGDLTVRPEEDSGAWENLGLTGRPPLINSTVIIISDFMEDPQVIHAAIARLAARNVRGHMLQVLDPAEVNLPYGGHVEFLDYRGGKHRLPKAEDFRKAYYEKLHAQQNALIDIAKRVGWNFSCHVTDRPTQEALMPLYENVGFNLPEFKDPAATGKKNAPGASRTLWQRLRGGPQP